MQELSKPFSRLSRIAFACLVLVGVAFTFWIALHRFVARDEGYFLYAAKLVLEGKLLYRDFFFPQPPLLPYVFAAFFWFGGTSWFVARILCACLTIFALSSIYFVTDALYGRRAARLSWIFSTLSMGIMVWFTTSQAYAFSTALSMLGLLMILKGRMPFLSGFLIGTAILARFTFAPISIVGIVFAWYQYRVNRRKQTALYILGGLASCLVVLPLVLPDLQNFYWHAIQYQTERTGLSEDEVASKRWHVFMVLLGIHKEAGMGGLQSPYLLLGGTAGLAYGIFRRKVADVFAMTGVALVIAHLAPSPTYVKYFSVVVPFFIPALCGLLCAPRLSGTSFIRSVSATVAIATFACLGFDNFRKFTDTGDDVIGVGVVNREAWRISAVSEISSMLTKHFPARSIIYTNWPGYLLEGSFVALPGTENHFGRAWADQNHIGAERRLRLQIRNRKEIVQSFAKGEAQAALLFIGYGRTNHPTEIDLKRVGAVEIDQRFYAKVYVPTKASANPLEPRKSS